MISAIGVTDFSYAAMSVLLLDAYPEYGSSLLQILSDNGLFSGQEEAPSIVE